MQRGRALARDRPHDLLRSCGTTKRVTWFRLGSSGTASTSPIGARVLHSRFLRHSISPSGAGLLNLLNSFAWCRCRRQVQWEKKHSKSAENITQVTDRQRTPQTVPQVRASARCSATATWKAISKAGHMLCVAESLSPRHTSQLNPALFPPNPQAYEDRKPSAEGTASSRQIGHFFSRPEEEMPQEGKEKVQSGAAPAPAQAPGSPGHGRRPAPENAPYCCVGSLSILVAKVLALRASDSPLALPCQVRLSALEYIAQLMGQMAGVEEPIGPGNSFLRAQSEPGAQEGRQRGGGGGDGREYSPQVASAVAGGDSAKREKMKRVPSHFLPYRQSWCEDCALI